MIFYRLLNAIQGVYNDVIIWHENQMELNNLVSVCPVKLGDAVKGRCALLLNECIAFNLATMYDQVNFDIYINLYIRLCSDLKEIR